MHYSIYILLGLGFVLFVLPCSIRLSLESASFSPHPRLYLDGLLGWRLVGLRLQPATSGWRLGLLAAGWPLPLLNFSLPASSRSHDKPTAKPAATKHPSQLSFSAVLELGRQLAAPTLYFLRYSKGALTLHRLYLTGWFGLSNPARTGHFHGWLQALQSLTGKRLRIRLNPDFTQTGLQGRLYLIIHLHLGYLLAHLLLFTLRVGFGRIAQRRPDSAHSPT
ncbi:MAG: hypothetical protein GKR89_17255 [Candidatus Latescibacteria bacterium]|nr:hypothetical protein [Candidatus Latescibacterota bacterium]